VTPRLVLASSSPRRAKLLTEAGFVFETKPADVDERVGRKAAIAEACVQVAERKARAIDSPGAWVLAADTLIDFEGRVLGKPADELEAHAILRMLSGNEHFVITGVALKTPQGAMRTGLAQTKVVFREISDAEIDEYIRTGDPLDKAGAYGIQGKASMFIESINGSYTGVVGLPIFETARLLGHFGFQLL